MQSGSNARSRLHFLIDEVVLFLFLLQYKLSRSVTGRFFVLLLLSYHALACLTEFSIGNILPEVSSISSVSYFGPVFGICSAFWSVASLKEAARWLSSVGAFATNRFTGNAIVPSCSALVPCAD